MKSTPNMRIYRYELAESALQAYREFNVLERVGGLASCSKFAPLKSFCLGVLPDGSVAMYGLNKCHCRSSCPICSLGRDVECLNEIQHAIWHSRKMGYGVYLVTFTFRHGSGDELNQLQSKFSEANQKLYRDHVYRDVLKSYGYVGRITDYEVQLCGNNGFHPHRHELYFMDPGMDLVYLEWEIKNAYLPALVSAGLFAKEDISVKVEGYEGVGNYITKMSSEICLGNHTKESRGGGSMSPFRCLQAWHETKDKYYAAWWVDYVLGIKGKRILGWSRGLKDLLGVREYKDELTSEKVDYKPLLVFEGEDSRRISISNWRTLAEMVNAKHMDEVLNCLNRLRISYYINPDGLRIYDEAF